MSAYDLPDAATRVLTADQFLTYILPSILTEAAYTQEHNEDRRLADYLADLSTLCERIIRGDLPVTDPTVAVTRPIDRMVTGRDLVEIARLNCDDGGEGCYEINPEYARGAWQTVLDALGASTEMVHDHDGNIVPRACQEALRVARPVMDTVRA